MDRLADLQGSREERLRAYRAVRDDIATKLGIYLEAEIAVKLDLWVDIGHLYGCFPLQAIGKGHMAKEGVIEFSGTVAELLPNAMFRVKPTMIMKCWPTPAAKCANRIRVLAGDRVNVEMTPYDLSKGRITFRFK